jgi:RHS repeat-associated protein
MLDDSGIIHMNGRLYDAELGRMLSADPYVQVPEYSQNFNRYSYVLNNPLNKTDPTGYSWLSKAFHKIGAWVKENWRSIVSIALGALLMFTGVGAMLAGNLLFGAMGLQSVSVLAFNATMGAITGGIMGAASAGLAGGDFGDILKGAAVGAVQGAISSGPLHAMEGVRGLEVAHVVGHGVTGGAANVAMGGKFQDGFLSAAAGAAATHTGIYGKFKGAGAINAAGRTAVAGIIGGTASALGAGKFANGAWTAAFQHLLNNEAQGWCVDCRAGDTYGSGSAGNLLDTTRALGEEFPFLANAERFVNDLVGDILYSCPPEALGCSPSAMMRGVSTRQTVTLYRAVSRDELLDVAENGFRLGPNSMGNKWFAENAADASSWGKWFYKYDKQSFFTLEIKAPKLLADKMMRVTKLDGIGPARSVDSSLLDALNKASEVRVLKGSVLPK